MAETICSTVVQYADVNDSAYKNRRCFIARQLAKKSMLIESLYVVRLSIGPSVSLRFYVETIAHSISFSLLKTLQPKQRYKSLIVPQRALKLYNYG